MKWYHVQAETIAVHELPYPANCKQTYLSHVGCGNYTTQIYWCKYGLVTKMPFHNCDVNVNTLDNMTFWFGWPHLSECIIILPNAVFRKIVWICWSANRCLGFVYWVTPNIIHGFLGSTIMKLCIWNFILKYGAIVYFTTTPDLVK